MEHYFTNNEALKSELRTINYKYKEYVFSFSSDNGVFSKDKIDYGSRLLVETFLETNKEKVESLLDVGCGYGFMGIVLSKILNCSATLIDVNKRAVHLTKMNIKENKVNAESYVSDVYENVEKKYDLIITNPPIRAGKEIVLNILNNGEEYLSDTGTLWFVIRKNQGAKSISKELENRYIINITKKDKGFYIINAKKKLT